MTISYGKKGPEGKKIRDAYDAGAKAKHEGKPLSDCPQGTDKDVKTAWHHGWMWGND